MKLDRLTLVIFTYLGVAFTLIFIGEAVALSLLIGHFKLETLLWVLLLDAVVRGVTGYLQGRFRRQSRHDRLLLWTPLLGIGIVGLAWLTKDLQLIAVLLFGVHRVLTDTLHYYLFPYIAPIFTAEHRRDFFTHLVVGSRLGAATLVLGMVPLMRAAYALELVRAWLVVAIGLVLLQNLIPKAPPTTAEAQQIAPPIPHVEVRRLFQSGLARWLTLSTIGVTLLTTILLYTSLGILQRYEVESVSTLFAFFALSSAGAVWVSFPIEYWIFERLLRRFDAGRLAWIYPSTLNLAVIGVLAVPVIPMAVVGHATRSTLQQSLRLPLERLLYHTLPVGEQQWLRYTLQSVVEPLARMMGVGILMLALGRPLWILGLSIPIGVGLLLVARQTGYLYGQALANSLSAGQYRVLRQTAGEWEINEHSMIPTLLSQLQERQVEASELLLIAEVVARSEDETAYQTLHEIWHESSASLQAELLPIIVDGWPDKCRDASHQELIFAALQSSYGELRARALELIAVYPSLDPEYQSARFLIDPNSKVNVVAATILQRHPIPDIQKAARAQLRWLAMDTRVSIRVAAVKALVQGSLNRFGEVMGSIDVEQYLRDPATRVREATLPAASISELIEAACDPAEMVRMSAAHYLAQRRWQGSMRQLVQALDETQPTPDIQIEGMMRYWRLVMALSTANKRMGWQRLMPALHKGFERLLVLRTMRFSLSQLKQPALEPLIHQLDYDHIALFDIMRDTLGVLVGRTRIQAIFQTLQSRAASADEQHQALHALQNLTTPSLAEHFRQLIQGDTAPHQQSTLPHVVLSILLHQHNEWHPILTLYCVSRLPNIQRTLWLSEPDAAAILERCAKSHLDVIREAVRLIKRLIAQEEPAEGTPMLSTLERMLFLRNVSFFQYLRLDQLRALARGCTEVSAQPGEAIIEQGAVGDGLYIVVEGYVQIQRRVEVGGKVVDLGMMGPSEVFGEVSLLDGEPRTADVIAETAVFLLSIHRDALQLALEDDPNIAMSMLRIMAQRLRRTTEQFDQHTIA
ncbi:MAG: cyclic nucleotide-binding domain-containing protein [Anaerolineales bacterium]|nr:cyclic nucleotide-binding domain-containing protein [Anaerolineales bacterium]